MFSRERSAAKSLTAAAAMRPSGYAVPGDLLTGAQLRELEPTLTCRAVAGYLISEERHIDPARLAAGLAGLARKSGTKIHERTEVTHFDRTGRQVQPVTAGDGRVPVDGVVLPLHRDRALHARHHAGARLRQSAG